MKSLPPPPAQDLDSTSRHHRHDPLPEVGRSVLQNSSLHAESIKMLLNLLSKEARYFARGWEPKQESRKNIMFCLNHKLQEGSVCNNRGWFTYRDHQEAYVSKPVGRLVGQLFHKEPQNSAEVALITCHRHFHRWGRLCIAVTARGFKIKRKGSKKKPVCQN